MIDKTNYFSYTTARWIKVNDLPMPLSLNRPDKISYKKRNTYERLSNAERQVSSQYWFTDKGVYRLSDHWGLCGSCLWKIKGVRNQYTVKTQTLCFAFWDSFNPQNDFELNEPQTRLQQMIEENYKRLNDISN